MRVLFLYPNNEGYFRCPIGLTLIMTVLKNEGHEIELFDTTFMNVEDNIDSKIREKAGLTNHRGQCAPGSLCRDWRQAHAETSSGRVQARPHHLLRNSWPSSSSSLWT